MSDLQRVDSSYRASGKFGTAVAALAFAGLVGSFCPVAVATDLVWNNTATGASAGDWFDAQNWTPMGVPDETTAVEIANGGTVLGNGATAPGPLRAKQITAGSDGNGTLNVNQVDVQVVDDFRVASGTNGTTRGNLFFLEFGSLEIGGAFSLGSVEGQDQAVGIANAHIVSVSETNVGQRLSIAEVRSSDQNTNVAFGDTSFSDGTLNVGSGLLAPANIELANVLVSEQAKASAEAILTLTRMDARATGDLIVGQLSLGSSDPQSFANGVLILNQSALQARNVVFARRSDGTQGSLRGRAALQASLIVAEQTIELGPGARLDVDLSGLVRADGNGGANQYSALDADQAQLAGEFFISTNSLYSEPSLGEIHTLEFISTTGGITGTFDEIFYDFDALSPDFGSVAGEFRDHVGNGTFRIVSYENDRFLFQNYQALPGDANGDFVVDGNDFIIWNSHKFTSGTDWITGDFDGNGITDGADFVIWNAHKFTSAQSAPATVPEPVLSLAALSLLGIVIGRRRSTASRMCARSCRRQTALGG